MANIIRFPRPFLGKIGAKASLCPKLCERFRENTRHKLRSVIARALEVLDNMERELPDECADDAASSRCRPATSPMRSGARRRRVD